MSWKCLVLETNQRLEVKPTDFFRVRQSGMDVRFGQVPLTVTHSK